MQDKIIFGIDLGTTNSSIAIYTNGQPVIIAEIPSYVAFTNSTKYVGIDAKNQKDINSENVFYETKRLVGRKYSEEKLQNEKIMLSYNIQGNSNDNILLVCTARNKFYSPEEILALILINLKQQALEWIGKKSEQFDAVITIPAYFSDVQRSAIMDSAKIAEINCLRIINEPTAAILAFGYLTKQINYTDSNIIVYDFGGGTLDISIVEISQGVYTVLGSAGNSFLGGANFDMCLMHYCIELFKRSIKIDISTILSTSIQKLRTSCEEAKKKLSLSLTAVIDVDNFYENFNLSVTITRKEFEEICKDILDVCIKPIDNLLEECSIGINEITDIILIGGMTRMPAIRELIKNKYKNPNCSINPESAVAIGAAIQGHILSRKPDQYTDTIVLLDITSLSLGIETSGGIMDILIKRGTILPHKVTRPYTTDTDNMTRILIKIYEGERTYVKDNIFIGEFELTIPPAPRMVPEINVAFEISIDGIITIVAELSDETVSNAKSELIVTTNKNKFTENEINRLINEAKECEFDDELKKAIYKLRYQIYNMCDVIIKNVSESSESGQAVKKDIDNMIINLNNENNIDNLKNILENIGYKYGNIAIKQVQNESIIEACVVPDNITVSCTTLYDENDSKNILITQCHNIYEKLNGKTGCTDILNLINDILIWVNITNNPSKLEIETHLNNLLEMYASIDLSLQVQTKFNELETLCYSIKLIGEENTIDGELDNLVDEALEYIESADTCDNNIIDYIDKINHICNSC
jgi:heat shock protein 1/8